ncbi:uncharacterized protein LOC105845464 isoform X1 [Hydra vulgaris]|uniref:Uncharacterized protein LOC105845464 isoform X1 n=1 Tax=Hydra vulgaris TaxID=6087 RepID=A0ABM4C4K9_HYDVU
MILFQYLIFGVTCWIASFVVSDWVETIYGTKVQFQPKLGKITISKKNELSIVFKNIVEIAENEITPKGLIVHSFSNFGNTEYKTNQSLDYEWVNSIDPPQNISAVRKNMTAKLEGPAAVFSVKFLIFENQTIISDINSFEKYEVFNGTVQVSITLEHWPFCGIAESCTSLGKYLDFYLQVEGLLIDPKPYDRRGVSLNSNFQHPLTYDYGGSDVTYSRQCLLNNTWYYIGDYPKMIKQDNQNIVVVRFPIFKTPITYKFMVNTSSYNFTAMKSSSFKRKSFEIVFGLLFIALIF